MFKIYDLNMKEITLPNGVMPLEIFVGSVAKNRVTEAVEGRSGVVDYGFNYTDRPVSLFLRIKAADAADFRLLRNEVFSTFDVGSAFYVAEADVPSRVLKVVVDESYIPERLTEEYADFDINCRTLDSVFWESSYTTLELHDNGYSAMVEKCGLVDNIDDEKVKYRFKNDAQSITISGWNDGGIGIFDGTVNPSNTNNIYSDEITVTPGMVISFEELTDHPNINFWRAFEYDGSTFIRFVAGESGTNNLSFIATGNRIRFSTSVYANMPVRATNVGVDVRPQVGNKLTTTNFKVYNAGNVTVEPESAQLYIQMNYATSDGNLRMTNKTTGETFEYYRDVDRRHIVLNRMVITEGGTNRFRDSNRRFISLAPGDNEFEITGATFDEIFFSFKYLYK